MCIFKYCLPEIPKGGKKTKKWIVVISLLKYFSGRNILKIFLENNFIVILSPVAILS